MLQIWQQREQLIVVSLAAAASYGRNDNDLLLQIWQ